MGGVGSGNPFTTSYEDALELLEHMEGKDGAQPLPLIKAADAVGIKLTTAYECIQRFPDLAERYAAAKEALADHYAEGSLETLEQGLDMIVSPSVDAKRTNAIASATRNLSERRAWAARMLSPQRYGDKVQHSGAIEHRAVVLLPQLVAAPAVTAPTVRATLASGDDATDADAPAG